MDLVVLGAIWGGSFLFMRVAAPEFGPVPLIAARVTVAACFLVAVLAVRGRLRQLADHGGPLLVIGALNAAIPFSLFAYAVLWITAGLASVLNATVPLFGALVAYVWLGEKLGWRRVLGLTIGFIGVVVLVSDRLRSARGSGLAVLAGLSAAAVYGIGANYTKRKLADVDPLVTATGSQVAALLILLVPAILSWPSTIPSVRSWSSALVLGVLCTGVAFVLFYRLLARLGPAKALTVTYLIPAFGVLWGFLFLKEPISTRMLGGAAIVLIGTALASGLMSSGR
jgi:drug/metabolite transporter (DMT)-like permease